MFEIYHNLDFFSFDLGQNKNSYTFEKDCLGLKNQSSQLAVSLSFSLLGNLRFSFLMNVLMDISNVKMKTSA